MKILLTLLIVLMFAPAYARVNRVTSGQTILFQSEFSSHAMVQRFQGGDGSLQDVLASTVFDLDATQLASYSGTGQVWSNLVTSPADGSSQTDNDFNLGGTSDPASNDPTFTGTAGTQAAHWAFDGGDFFKKETTNTDFINNLHKTTGGQDFWALWAGQIGGVGTQYLFGDFTTSSTGLGMLTTTNKLNLRQRGTANTTATGTDVYTTGTDLIFIVSHSHSTNTTRIWSATRTAEEIAHTFNTTTADASRDMQLDAIGNGSSILKNLSRQYTFAMGNEYLDNTKAGLLFDALDTRHGRTY